MFLENLMRQMTVKVRVLNIWVFKKIFCGCLEIVLLLYPLWTKWLLQLAFRSGFWIVSWMKAFWLPLQLDRRWIHQKAPIRQWGTIYYTNLLSPLCFCTFLINLFLTFCTQHQVSCYLPPKYTSWVNLTVWYFSFQPFQG